MESGILKLLEKQQEMMEQFRAAESVKGSVAGNSEGQIDWIDEYLRRDSGVRELDDWI